MQTIEDSVGASIEIGRNNTLRNVIHNRQFSMENDPNEEN